MYKFYKNLFLDDLSMVVVDTVGTISGLFYIFIDYFSS